MMLGQEKPDSGDFKVGESVKVAYVDQSRDSLQGEQSVWQEVSGGLDQLDLGGRIVQSRAYLSWFAFKGADQQKRVKDLSGGERNRVHLAKVLKAGGNLILLDEPTNDLDVETLRSLEEALESFAGCAVIISHDRWFLDRVATHILAFEGDSKVEWFEGNFQDYEADKKKRLGADAVPRRIDTSRWSANKSTARPPANPSRSLLGFLRMPELEPSPSKTAGCAGRCAGDAFWVYGSVVGRLDRPARHPPPSSSLLQPASLRAPAQGRPQLFTSRHGSFLRGY